MAGIKISLTEMLLALAVDGINTMIWQQTKDGMKGRNRPESIFKKLTEEKQPKEDLETFDDVASFEDWYRAKMRID